MLKKLKSWLSDDALYIAGVLLLVGIVSFGLGRLSVGDGSPAMAQSAVVGLVSGQNRPKTTMVQATSTADEVTPPPVFTTSSAPFLGSKSGTKYHKVTCPGAKTIKDSNKIYFQSESEAEASGYSRAANCKW